MEGNFNLTLKCELFPRPHLNPERTVVKLNNTFSFVSIGLYLYMLVVETFSGDNLKFALYATIGWGEFY